MMIRKMTPEDIKQVAQIEAESFSMPWSETSFLESIKRDDTIFLVAESKEDADATILGYIGMYVAFEEGEITNVAVGAMHRGHGIGQSLVEAMIDAAKAKGLERIVLEVRVSNAHAISLYKRNEFTNLGIRKKFYERPVEDAMIMACEI